MVGNMNGGHLNHSSGRRRGGTTHILRGAKKSGGQEVFDRKCQARRGRFGPMGSRGPKGEAPETNGQGMIKKKKSKD